MKGLCIKHFRFLIFSACTLLLSSQAQAMESFRVHKTVLVTLPSSAESQSVEATCNDAVAIILPEDKTYIQGVEISVKVPQLVAEWHDSVAWFIYTGIQPRPTEKRIDYSGERAHVGTFGVSLRKTIQIPLVQNNTIRRDAYSEYLSLVPPEEDGMIFFRRQLAMKGTPNDLTNAKFEITVRPLLIDKGKLHLSTKAPDSAEVQPYTVFIDGKAVSDIENQLLDTGVHTLSLVSDSYRNEVRTFTISQAKTTDLTVQFRDITPLLLIAAPEGTLVFLDGEAVSNIKEPVAVSQGEHSVRFTVGDYEVVKQLSAVNGRTYTIAVNLDASISESE
ncbi:MAG TPA: hypothetical protein DC014_04820 [Treponema sp.]|nr:hypothetical protein [Treponema sp.]